MELEKGNPPFEEVISLVGGTTQKACYENGDLNGGAIPCGEVVGRIKDVLSVKEVIDDIVLN